MPILSIEVRLPPGTDLAYGTCASCGCVDERACPGGCFWIDWAHMLCSACMENALAAVDLRKPLTPATTTAGRCVSLVLLMRPPKVPRPRRRRRRRRGNG